MFYKAGLANPLQVKRWVGAAPAPLPTCPSRELRARVGTQGCTGEGKGAWGAVLHKYFQAVKQIKMVEPVQLVRALPHAPSKPFPRIFFASITPCFCARFAAGLNRELIF